MMQVPPAQNQPHMQPVNNQAIPSPGPFIPQTPQTPHHAPQFPQQFVPSPGHRHSLPPAGQQVYDNRSMAPTPAALAPRGAPMAMAPSPAPMAPHQMHINHGVPQHGGHYNPPQPQVYTLPEVVDEGIPDDVRQQFQRDDSGHVLFFTTPPVYQPHLGISEEHANLGHSARFLADKKKLEEERLRKRKERDEEQQRAAEEASRKRKLGSEDGDGRTGDGGREAVAALGLLTAFVETINRQTVELDRDMEGWATEKAKWQTERTQGIANGISKQTNGAH